MPAWHAEKSTSRCLWAGMRRQAKDRDIAGSRLCGSAASHYLPGQGAPHYELSLVITQASWEKATPIGSCRVGAQGRHLPGGQQDHT